MSLKCNCFPELDYKDETDENNDFIRNATITFTIKKKNINILWNDSSFKALHCDPSLNIRHSLFIIIAIISLAVLSSRFFLKSSAKLYIGYYKEGPHVPFVMVVWLVHGV